MEKIRVVARPEVDMTVYVETVTISGALYAELRNLLEELTKAPEVPAVDLPDADDFQADIDLALALMTSEETREETGAKRIKELGIKLDEYAHALELAESAISELNNVQEAFSDIVDGARAGSYSTPGARALLEKLEYAALGVAR